jgi:adenylosuccinate synthase
VSLWVVVGGQYGGEGKGKISAFITRQEEIDICIRCGGPNSGHSFVTDNGDTVLLRQLPTGYIRAQTRLLIPAGALIDLQVLKYELDALGLDLKRVGIDRNAMIIEESDKVQEAALQLRERLSSTLCGVGSAVARRALRGADVRTAAIAGKEVSWLAELITDVSEEANSALDRGRKVLVEGTQGFGLSLYHSESYPKATSRDTTTAGFLSEVGLSPRLVTEVVLVLRTFPIRVAGAQAGPMKDEITWEVLQRESGYPHPIEEMTTVTKKLRRVARFDWGLAAKAIRVSRPTRVVINGLDYLDYANKSQHSSSHFTSSAIAFLRRFDETFQVPVALCGTGPAISEIAVVRGMPAGTLEEEHAEILG